MPDKTPINLKKPSHLKDLTLLFSVPIGVAVLAAGIVYMPRLFANPKTDFIYAYCNNYDCYDSYNVDSSGHIYRDSSQYTGQSYNRNSTTLRYYDASDNATKNLTLEEAARIYLDTSSKSPDGYTLGRESTDSGFLFWGNYDDAWYLKNGAKKKKVDLSNSGSYYSQAINFLGWVTK